MRPAHIPAETWRVKLRKTVLGGLIVVGTVLMKREGWFADWFHMIWLFVGGYLVAGDVVRGIGTFVQETGKNAAEGIRAIVQALKGRNSNGGT